MDLSKRVAVVTGSGQGIGREIALLLAEHGASVVTTDINAATAKEIAAEIEAKKRKSIAIPANVSLAASIMRAIVKEMFQLGNTS